jgi:hypothetical protein
VTLSTFIRIYSKPLIYNKKQRCLEHQPITLSTQTTATLSLHQLQLQALDHRSSTNQQMEYVYPRIPIILTTISNPHKCRSLTSHPRKNHPQEQPPTRNRTKAHSQTIHAPKLRGLMLHNRIMLSPFCRYSAQNGHRTGWNFAHLAGIILQGPGIAFIEATAVLPEG